MFESGPRDASSNTSQRPYRWWSWQVRCPKLSVANGWSINGRRVWSVLSSCFSFSSIGVVATTDSFCLWLVGCGERDSSQSSFTSWTRLKGMSRQARVGRHVRRLSRFVSLSRPCFHSIVFLLLLVFVSFSLRLKNLVRNSTQSAASAWTPPVRPRLVPFGKRKRHRERGGGGKRQMLLRIVSGRSKSMTLTPTAT